MSVDRPESSNHPRLLFSVDGTRYELVRKLGRKNNGELLLAQRRYAKGPAGSVIIKRLSRPVSEKQQQRLKEEVQLAYRLDHPGIAKVYQLVLHGGLPYVVMEYVEGRSLETVLSIAAMRQRLMSEAFVCHVVSEVADALHHAHTRTDEHGRPLGIVHRDISPENIRVGSNGEVKLVDFGVAYSLLPGREATTASVLRGDIAYAAPERMRLEKVDHRSDLFSLGLVMLELLTGKHLFDLDGVEQAARAAGPASAALAQVRCEEPSWVPIAEMAARIERFGPEDVERATQGISEPLRAVAHRALRRNPAERYQSGLELRDALREFLVVQGRSYGRPEAAREVLVAVKEAELLRESADVIEPDVFPEEPARKTEH
ncbi:serine/threonine-protein kinase [Vitiosangium sp. GDMCC 1.1324]|uniref:serine/threonine-protein kinase n=1 Tax=Vitiosangium sp. (strain GDMCC 1.1324) TaxID=2138576 RepID=UPI000D3CF5D1|nr:serine/threonine-protein kinase [Vitiosangium sp. GDMCC 1.1324]PTL85876.1 serine/threonine protein kinase [Vitiosangium sp. GDMCC 1.1324]